MRLSNNFSSSVAIEQYLLEGEGISFQLLIVIYLANFKLIKLLYCLSDLSVYLLPLHMTLYLCVRFEAHLSRSHSKVHTFKLRQKTVPMVYWGRDSCKFRFPSNRSAPKLLKALNDGVHFHRNDQHYNQNNTSHEFLFKGWWLKCNKQNM